MVDGHVSELTWQSTVKGANLAGYYYAKTMWDYRR